MNTTATTDQLPFAKQNTEDTRLIPVLEEQLQVIKEQVETGRVQINKRVESREEVVATPLVSSEVEVERVAINTYVDTIPAVRQEGETTIYPVMVEEVVVQKRLKLVEEIRVTRRQTESMDTQTVTLLREQVSIDRLVGNVPSERSESDSGSSL